MKKRFILLILSVLFVSSCDDFFYPDLIDGSYIYGISDCDCKSIDTVEVVEVIENDYTKAYTKASPSVGVVYVSYEESKYQIITGTIYKEAEDGYYMITSVVDNEKAPKYEIILGDYIHFTNDEISYIGTYMPFRLSILKITTDLELRVPTIADSETIAIGESILAIGTPGSIDVFNTLTKGVISGVNEMYEPALNPPYQTDLSYNVVGFTIDAPTNYGERGGGVFSTKGELLGIISERYYVSQSSSTSITIDSFSFVIGVRELEVPFNEIIESGTYTKPLMGVTVMDLYGLSAFQKEYLNGENNPDGPMDPAIPLDVYHGLFISGLLEGGASEKAGVPVGHVITHIEGNLITRRPVLDKVLLRKVQGDQVTITVLDPITKTSQDITITL